MSCKHRGDYDSSPTLWDRFRAAWRAFRNPQLGAHPVSDIRIDSIDELKATVEACIASGDKPKLHINPALYNDPELRPTLDRLVLEHPASQPVTHCREQEHRGVKFVIGATPEGFMPRNACGQDLLDFTVESVESAIEHARTVIDDMIETP